MKIVPALYHTYPAGMLEHIDRGSPVFIEATGCLQNGLYRVFFEYNMYNRNTILDCGVGMSPDLKNPTAHISTDPHWAAKYLELLLDIEPQVVIIPDILNDAPGTWNNFLMYTKIIDRLMFSTRGGHRRPKWMYVVQGKTKGEARDHIELALNFPYIDYIGFPRIVDYYGDYDGDVLGRQRIDFVEIFLERLQSSGKQIHLLGMNSIHELKFAAANELSLDTRIASMAALGKFNVTKSRPLNLNLDLNRIFTRGEITTTLINVKTLNNIYESNRESNTL